LPMPMSPTGSASSRRWTTAGNAVVRDRAARQGARDQDARPQPASSPPVAEVAAMPLAPSIRRRSPDGALRQQCPRLRDRVGIPTGGHSPTSRSSGGS
jgi:hypothetical protein